MVDIRLSAFLTSVLLFFLPPETLNELEFFYLPGIDPADFKAFLVRHTMTKVYYLVRTFESVEKGS